MNELIVFTNSRNIREYVANFSDIILPKMTTIGAFFSEILYHKTYVECSEISRIVYLNEAVKNTQNLESKLHIKGEFFEFLKNKEYLFSFFKELSDSMKTVSDLKSSDIYAEYEDHLEILENLLSNYKEILAKNKVYDEITLASEYEIDEYYIKSFDKITVQIDGILTNFNIEILRKIKSLTTIILKFQASNLNENLVQNLENLTNLNIEQGFIYELNLATNELIKVSSLPHKKSIKFRGFKDEVLEALYVYTKISSFIKDGISPQDIAVILPDEDFSEILKLYDFNNMLNFAMGKKLKNTLFYQTFTSIINAIKEDKELDFSDKYLEKCAFTKTELFLNLANLNSEIYAKFKENFKKNIEFSKFESLIYKLLEVVKEESLKSLLVDPLYELDIFMRSFNLKFFEICEIFSMLIRNVQIDHVGGGKVSVMGVLESRGMKFKGVIIPRFNDNLVPTRVVNEMFLNSQVRKRADLISYKQRENLQRFYYKNLISNARSVAISYKNADDAMSSRFLKEFDLIEDLEFSDEDYINLLKTSQKELNSEPTTIKITHNFFEKPLSFSKLNDYLNCPKYYAYKRIYYIQDPKPVDDKNNNLFLGNKLHDLVANSYDDTKFNYTKFCDLVDSDKELDEIYQQIIKKSFVNFGSLIDKGGIVKHEVEFENVEFEGVLIKGKIDRIEKTHEDIFLVDYKLGKLDNALKTYQLAFYEALLGVENAISSYFSFRLMKKDLPHKDANLENLKKIINELKELSKSEIEFEENSSFCRNCPYTLICKRIVNG